MPAHHPPRWLRAIRPHDVGWVLLFAALIASAPVGDAPEVAPLAALAVAQVLEPRISALESKRWCIPWIVLKLALASRKAL